MDIPFDLLYIVASFHTKPRMKLLDWIPEEKLNWKLLSRNSNLLNAIHLLEKYPDKIDWYNLSGNPNAIHLLEKYPDKIDWDMLSKNPNAIHLLEKYPDKINWDNLSRNLNAIHILEKNIDKIVWVYLSENSSIFEIDTKQTNLELIKRAKNIYY